MVLKEHYNMSVTKIIYQDVRIEIHESLAPNTTTTSSYKAEKTSKDDLQLRLTESGLVATNPVT